MRKSAPGKLIATIGATLQISFLVGAGLFLTSIVGTFNEIIVSDEAGDAASLSKGVSDALKPLGISVVISIAGFVLMLCSLWIFNFRENWFYGVLLVSTLPLMISQIPVGTFIGIGFLIYFLSIRKQFNMPAPNQSLQGTAKASPELIVR